MSSNLINLQQVANWATIDNVVQANADVLYIDGVEFDPTNFVPYTGALKTLNMGGQNIQTSHVPSANSDVVNNLALNNAVAGISVIIASNLVPYSGANDNTDLGTYTISTTAVPTVGKNLTNKTYVDTQDALKVSKSGDTMTGTLVVPSITATSLATATPSYTLGINGSNQIIKYANPAGVFTGNVDASYIPLATSTNVFGDSLLTQSGTTITNSGNQYINGTLTTAMGYGQATNFGEVVYTGVNAITSAVPTTTGLTACAPASGTITYSAPTYTLTFTTQYLGCMWSNATFQPNIRTFFKFTNFNYIYAVSSSITIAQANTANTAYTYLTGAIPLVVGTFINYFVPNSVSGYTGQIFFIFSGAKFGAVSWDTFSYGYGALTAQGNAIITGTTQLGSTLSIAGVTTTTGDVNLINSALSVTNNSTYQTIGLSITNTGGGTTKNIQLSVAGSSGWASQGAFGIYNGATASGESYGFPLIILPTSGNIGIGTTAPTSLLHVKTTTNSSFTTPHVLIQNTQTNPKNCLTVLGSGVTTGNSVLLNIGQDLSINNAMGIGYVHSSSGSANNRLGISAYGSGDGLTITAGGKVGIGNYSPATSYAGYYKQLITGTYASTDGAHVEYFTTSDNYPLFQQLNWSHDNVNMNFDLYYDGTWRNSDTSAGWRISKNSGGLTFDCYAPSSAGSASTFYQSLKLTLGQATFPLRAVFQGVYTSTAQPYCQIGGNGGGNLAVGAGAVVLGNSTMTAYQSVGMVNNIGSGWDTGNGRFWIVTEGRWMININFYFNSFIAGTRLQLQRVASGGTVVETRYCCLIGTGVVADTTYSYAGEMYCYSGDYLRVVVASGGGCTFYYGGMDHSHLTFTFLS